MAERKAFLLRVEPALLEAVQRWANDDLRSLNGQIEFVLREALRNAGRLRGARAAGTQESVPAEPEHEAAGHESADGNGSTSKETGQDGGGHPRG